MATYSPEDIVLSVNDFVISHFANGSFLEVIQHTPNFRVERGIRGKHTRVHNRDKSGTIVFQLMQTSSQNDVLSELATKDDLNMTGHLFVVLRDVGGSTGVQAINAYVEGVPNLRYQGDTSSPREWKIHYETFAQYNVAGGSKNVLDIVSNLS